MNGGYGQAARSCNVDMRFKWSAAKGERKRLWQPIRAGGEPLRGKPRSVYVETSLGPLRRSGDGGFPVELRHFGP